LDLAKTMSEGELGSAALLAGAAQGERQLVTDLDVLQRACQSLNQRFVWF
jgi:hypothetical protein